MVEAASTGEDNMASKNMDTLQMLIGGPNFSEDRTTEEFKQKMAAAISPDVELHEASSLPHGGVHKGLENFGKARGIMMGLWDQKLDVVSTWEVPDADVIVVMYMMEWTAKATGRSASLPGVEIVTFKDGAIAKLEFFHLDTKAILDTLDES